MGGKVTEYYKRPFGQRLGQMGDAAEEAYIEHVNPDAIRMGLNRPNLHVPSMPIALRSAPDIMDHSFFVECVGIGRDSTAKVRMDKTDALRLWSVIAPVKIFVWNSTRKVWWLMDFDAFENACRMEGELDRFPDNNKPFWRLHSRLFPGDPHGTS